MTGTREAVAAGIAGLMRAPLSRVELAASQLARDAATPVARELSLGIRAAVGDLDRLIEELFALWAPPRSLSPGERRDSLGELLAELHRRVAPVFAARGVTWSLREDDALCKLPAGDFAREIALALLRAGADLAGSGGSLDLSAECHRPDRAALRLSFRRGDSADPASASRVLEGLASRLQRCGGEVEPGRAGADDPRLLVSWCTEASCSES